MIKLKSNYEKTLFVLSGLIIFSFFYGFIIGEDSLGGAKHDYIFHEKYFSIFAEDFQNTINNYGNNDEVRNSPLFYILFSKLVKLGFANSDLKYFNLVIVFPLILFFFKSIKIKYKKISLTSQIILTSTILLSPTIRSLVSYPYPLLWAISFFLISIYFFLKFEISVKKEKKYKNSFFCILNLAIASYFTPNFSVFILFYGYKFFVEFKFSRKFFSICFFAIILALPALFFLIWKDFYLFKNEVYDVHFFQKYNFSNKIIIIFSFIFLFILPFFKKFKISKNIKKKIDFKNTILIFLIFMFLVFLFDFKSGAGGGIFYQFSNIAFKNNIFVYFIFFISLIIFYLFRLYNLNNIFLFVILLLYNLQYTIYYKYFDPLLIFIFLFLFIFDKNKIEKIDKIAVRYFIFYSIFLTINLFKIEIKNFLI